MKKYKKQTKELGIPVLSAGDIILPEVEMEKYTKIENLLLAGLGGMKTFVFEEGNFHIEEQDETNVVVSLHANGYNSASGIVGGCYFKGKQRLVWDNLVKGREYYLYIKKNERLDVNPSDFTTISKRRRKDSDLYCLMAVVDLTTDYTIDTSPIGKRYSRDVYDHLINNENPHGETLVQSTLKVLDKIKFNLTGNSIPLNINDSRDNKLPVIQTDGELVFSDKRSTIQISDDKNEKLNRDGSLFNVLNSLSEDIQSLKNGSSGFETDFLYYEGSEDMKFTIQNSKEILAVNHCVVSSGDDGIFPDVTIKILNRKTFIVNADFECKLNLTVHYRIVDLDE